MTLTADSLAALERKAFRDTLTPEALRDHHLRYCRYIQSQNGVLAEDNQTQWLVKACKAFNNLEAVAYGKIMDPLSERRPYYEERKPTSWKACGPLGQQELVDPQAQTDLERYALSFLALPGSRSHESRTAEFPGGCSNMAEFSTSWR